MEGIHGPLQASTIDVCAGHLFPSFGVGPDVVSDGLSNGKRPVSIQYFGAVKWNLKNIFFKFGVSIGYDAIIVARSRREERAS